MLERSGAAPPIVEIVVTPGSGNGRALGTARALRDAAHARGWPARVRVFRTLGRLSRWSATCPQTFSHLVCVGGDATMSAASTAAIRHRVPLVPVPSGFGNLFAQAFGHTDDVEAVLATLCDGDLVWIDAGTSHGQPFLCHESFGLLEDVQSTVEQPGTQPRSRFMRWLAYYRAAIRLIARARSAAIRVEVDGTLLARRAVLVTVANVRAYGSFLSLTPDASPTDGLLDVFAIPRTSTLGLCRRLLTLLLRLPRQGDLAVTAQGRRVSITLRGKRTAEIRVMPRVLPVLVPARRTAAPAHPSAVA